MQIQSPVTSNYKTARVPLRGFIFVFLLVLAMFSLIIDGETKESKYELIVFLEIGLEIVLHCL